MVVEEPFGTDVRPTVIADEEDDGIVRQPALLKPVENHPHLGVHVLHLIQIAGELLADARMIGHIGGQLHGSRIDGMFRLAADAFPPVAAVGDVERDLREERSVRREHLIVLVEQTNCVTPS